MARLRADWIAAFLLNPQQFSPHSNMPRQLTGGDAQDAADIAAYLAIPSMAATPPRPAGSREEGLALYESLNCLACHRLTPPQEDDRHHRVSLHFVNAKYSRDGLVDYLGRGHTPAYKLSLTERASLAAYLHEAAKGSLQKPEKDLVGNAFRGSDLLAKRDCLRCHSTEGDRTGKAAIRGELPLEKLDRGCLADDAAARGTAPQFAWADGERQAVAAYLRNRDVAPAHVSLGERSAQLVAELRCQACHNRDGRNGDRLAILDEESETGYIPELLPDLTWAGEKLQTSWLTQLLAGKIEKPTRVWLKGRMPAFPQHAELLSQGLAAEHGLAPQDETPEMPLADLVAQGEKLTFKENLDCRQCHAIGKLEAAGDDKTRLAPGINFALVKERLRHDYYRRFVLDPPRFDATTRMVKLAPDGKTTKVTSFYDGDAAKQFEAIWNYIQSVPDKK
jgi:mono/diheme cytochrome c family protein